MKHTLWRLRPDLLPVLFSVCYYAACSMYFYWLASDSFTNVRYLIAGVLCWFITILAFDVVTQKSRISVEPGNPVFTLRQQKTIRFTGLALSMVLVVSSLLPKFDRTGGILPEMSVLGCRLDSFNRLPRKIRADLREFSMRVTDHLLVDPKSEMFTSKLQALAGGELYHGLVEHINSKFTKSNSADLVALKSVAPSFIGHEEHLRVSSIKLNSINQRGFVFVDVAVEDRCDDSKKVITYSIGIYKPSKKFTVLAVSDQYAHSTIGNLRL